MRTNVKHPISNRNIPLINDSFVPIQRVEQPTAEALAAVRQQVVAYVDETEVHPPAMPTATAQRAAATGYGSW